ILRPDPRTLYIPYVYCGNSGPSLRSGLRKILNWRCVAGVEGFGFASQIGDTLHQTQAAIPAKQRVIIALRADFFRLFIVVEGVFKACAQGMGMMSGAKLGFGASLLHDPQRSEE